MIVTCEQCQARFKLADEKIKPEGTKVRCSKCQSIFTVLPPPVPAEPVETPAPPVAAEPPPEESPAPEQPAAEQEHQEAEHDQPATEPPPETAAGMEFDFSEEGRGSSGDEEAGSFSFDSSEEDDDRTAGGFNFEETFTEEGIAPSTDRQPAEGPVEFDFDDMPASGEAPADSSAIDTGEFAFSGETQEETDTGDFDFAEEESSAVTAGEFDFAAGEGDSEPEGETDAAGFDFSAESSSFGEISFDEEKGSDFSLGDQPEEEDTDFGSADDSWGASESGELGSFDFEEPKFDDPPEAAEPKPASLGFGEIDFSDDESEGALPSFDSPTDFARPPEQPPQTFAPAPPETAAPPPPRQPVSRPRPEAHPPAAPPPRRSPVSKMVVMLGVLLLVLCGAGGYLYMSGDGERLVNQAIMKIKGEKPAGPVVQMISFSNIATSYVNNQEAGQLLVVQGMVTNNFPGSRSAIAVKGLLLDGAGKVLQQQTVFCGNYLSEEKLRTLKYAAIEEAMGNQFGDSLSNMNVKPGASLKFTIVFRNVPAEIANINFEPVDSKPGSN